MKKYRYKLPLPMYIFVIALAVLSVVLIILNIFRWCEFFDFYSINLVFEITQTVLAAIAIAVCSIIAFMRYTVDRRGLRLPMITDVFKGQITPERISSLVVSKEKLYLCFTNKDFAPQIILIAIDKSLYDDFINTLRDINPKILARDADPE